MVFLKTLKTKAVFLAWIISISMLSWGASDYPSVPDYPKSFMDDDLPGIKYNYRFVSTYGHASTDIAITSVEVNEDSVPNPVVVYPATYAKSWGVTLREIDARAFAQCPKIKKVSLAGTSLRKISDQAFEKCPDLEEVVIGWSDGNITMGGGVFGQCPKLKSVSIGNEVSSMGGLSFYDCQQLESVSLGTGLKQIGSRSFEGCSSLETIVFKEGITSVGANMFVGCGNLKEVHFLGACPSYSGLYTGAPTTIATSADGLPTGWPIGTATWCGHPFAYNGVMIAAHYPLSESGLKIEFYSDDEDHGKYYTLDGRDPVVYGKMYEQPFCLTSDGTVKVTKKDELGLVYKKSFVGEVVAPTGNAIRNDDGTWTVSLGCSTDESNIHYAIGDLELSDSAQSYAKPFIVPAKTSVSFFATRDGMRNSVATTLKVGYVYSIVFDANGGLGGETVSYELGTELGALPTPRRTGHTFTGWYTALNGGTRITSNTKVLEDATYYAHWSINSFEIIFDANGGAGGGSKTLQFGSALENLPSASRDGYVFVGWFTQKSGGERISSATLVSRATTYYAQWQINSYNVIIDYNYDGADRKTVAYSHGDKLILPDEPMREGYEFIGWYTMPSGGVEVQTGCSVLSDMTIFARWTKLKTYVISFNANGGYGTMASRRVVSGRVYKLPICSFGREGYEFGGWSESPAGGVMYADGIDVTRDQNQDDEVVLYAVWYKLSNCRYQVLSSGGVAILGITDVALSSEIRIPSQIDGRAVVEIGEDAFRSCSSIVSVIIPSSVVRIGANAFKGCTEIRSATVPSSFKMSEIFPDCYEKIQTVTVPEGVENVKSIAFYGCGSLVSISLPSTLKQIGSSAFEECSSLCSVSLPAGVIRIDDTAFAYCKKLTSIEIPQGVTKISAMLFWGCSELESVKLSPSITSIGRSAFRYCGKLNVIRLSRNLVTIEENAFGDCGSLRTFVVDEGDSGRVKQLLSQSGFDCTGVEFVELLTPEFSTCESSVEGVKLKWSNLEWAVGYNIYRAPSSQLPDTALATVVADGACEYFDASGEVGQTYWYWVEAVGEMGATECKLPVSGIKQNPIVISPITYLNLLGTAHANPETYQEGSSVAFTPPSGRIGYTFTGWTPAMITADMTGSQTVTAGWRANTYQIVYYANGGSGTMEATACEYNKEVEIAANSFVRSGYVFKGWATEENGEVVYEPGQKVTNLTGDDGAVVKLYALWAVKRFVVTFGANGGEGGIGLEVDYGSEVLNAAPIVKRPGYAFVGWFTTPDGGDRVSSSVVAEADVTYYAHWQPYSYNAVFTYQVNFDSTVSITGLDQSSLTTGYIAIPEKIDGKKVTSIGGWAFDGCSGLVAISIPKGVVSIGCSAFYGCSGLVLVDIPDSVTTIGSSAFYGCSGLSSVHIPNSVISIESWAFGTCRGLTSVTIPSSVISIGSLAFDACNELVSVVIPSSVKEIGSYAFPLWGRLTTVYVDKGDVERVKSLCTWPDNVEFVERVVPAIVGDLNATVSGDGTSGFVVKPSEGNAMVEVTIPQGIYAAKVTVEVSPKVESVKPNGAKVKVVVEANDITGYLVIPESCGVMNIAAATVKEEIVKETLDPSKDAVIELNAANPRLTTAPTRKGLTYTLFEGRKLELLSKGDSKLGDGDPWKPTITVSGGDAAFYSIDVSK